MWNIVNFLSSSIIAGVIGLVSLIIGIISLWITVKTMKTAKLIEIEIRNSQNQMAQKNDFKDQIPAVKDKLCTYIKTVSNNNKLTRNCINESITLMTRIMGYKDILSTETVNKANETCAFLDRCSSKTKMEQEDVVEYLKRITEIETSIRLEDIKL